MKNPAQQITKISQQLLANLSLYGKKTVSFWDSLSTNSNRIYLIVITFGLVLGLLAWSLVWVPKSEKVRVANLATRSLSVTWLTSREARGCAYLFSISPRPYLARQCHEDETSLGHAVGFSKLQPGARYGAVVVGGLLRWSEIVWSTTRQISDEPPSAPQSAYGAVFKENGDPAPFALVYLYTMTNRPQYPVAVLTNAEGRYATSLTNLMLDGQSFIIESWASPDEFNRIETDVRYSTPFAPVHLRRVQ